MKIIIILIAALFLGVAGWGVYLSKTYIIPEITPEISRETPVPVVELTFEPTILPMPVQQATSNSGDTAPPSAPSDLNYITNGFDQINISWRASRDDKKVLGYDIYRDGIVIGSTVYTYFGDISLPSEQSFSYYVVAYDAAGNRSAPSVSISAKRDTSEKIASVRVSTATSTPATPALTPTSGTAPVPIQTQAPIQSMAPALTPTTALTPVPTPIPTVAPAITPTPIPTPSGYTATQIATHNIQSNCWVYLRTINKVYNITGYVANPGTHPGGNVIVPFCGKDIYDYFIGSGGGHRHSSSALNNTLQAYYIGPLL